MKRLIATIAVAALALGSLAATPASALDQDQRNAVALGLGALAIIGAINESKKNDDRYTTRNYSRYDNDYRDDWRRDDWRRDDWRHDDRYRHGSSRYLPGRCSFDIRTDRGPRSVLGGECLRQNRVSTRSLPDRCEMNVRTRAGTRQVFGESCLRGAGYRIASR